MIRFQYVFLFHSSRWLTPFSNLNVYINQCKLVSRFFLFFSSFWRFKILFYQFSNEKNKQNLVLTHTRGSCPRIYQSLFLSRLLSPIYRLCLYLSPRLAIPFLIAIIFIEALMKCVCACVRARVCVSTKLITRKREREKSTSFNLLSLKIQFTIIIFFTRTELKFQSSFMPKQRCTDAPSTLI